MGFPFSSIEPSDCRLRLRYTSFDKMTKNERLTWLFCAYEKLKEGDDRYLHIFKDNSIKVWDADFEVHTLYKKGKAGYNSIISIYPELKDKEEIDSVRRISNSASWLAENYEKVPLLVLVFSRNDPTLFFLQRISCLLYTSDAADE